MALTPEVWDKIRTSHDLPADLLRGIRAVFDMPYDKVILLPEGIRENKVSRPGAEYSTFDESYLEFLQEQIDLNARGREWSQRLEKRLAAVQDYANHPLLNIHIYADGWHLSMELLPDSLELIHSETCAYTWD